MWWLVFSGVLLLFYAYQLLSAYVVWINLPKINRQLLAFLPETYYHSFSMVIPFRNEEDNLPFLLQNLSKIAYPSHLWEIILVNDFSEDNSVQVIENELEKYPNLKVKVCLNTEKKYTHVVALKKNAITTGVSHAQYDWIVTSDADCLHEASYLEALNEWIICYNPSFVSGPVAYKQGNLFQNMQALEFMGLVGLGATYLHRNLPLLCNGANTAYPKWVFESVAGYMDQKDASSGDDVWLMQKIQKRFPFQLLFAKDQRLVVSTSSNNSTQQFWHQRKRWTSKNVHFFSLKPYSILLAHYLFYTSLVVNAVLSLWYFPLLIFLIIMVLGKMIVELLFFTVLKKWFGFKNLWFTYLCAFALQVLYTVFIVPASQLGHFEWKNRKLKK